MLLAHVAFMSVLWHVRTICINTMTTEPKEMLQQWDKSHRGTISRVEFRQGARESFGLSFDNKDLDAWFAKFDKSGNDQIDLEELTAALNGLKRCAWEGWGRDHTHRTHSSHTLQHDSRTPIYGGRVYTHSGGLRGSSGSKPASRCSLPASQPSWTASRR